MHPEDHHRARITKLDKDFARDLDFKDIYFQLKLGILKTEKKSSIAISVFGYENKEKYPIYVSKKNAVKKIVIYY